MHAVHLVLTSETTPHPTPADADGAEAAVGTHALPQDGLDHLYARVGPGRIDLALLLRAPERPTTHVGPPLRVLQRLVAPLTE